MTPVGIPLTQNLIKQQPEAFLALQNISCTREGLSASDAKAARTQQSPMAPCLMSVGTILGPNIEKFGRISLARFHCIYDQRSCLLAIPFLRCSSIFHKAQLPLNSWSVQGWSHLILLSHFSCISIHYVSQSTSSTNPSGTGSYSIIRFPLPSSQMLSCCGSPPR